MEMVFFCHQVINTLFILGYLRFNFCGVCSVVLQTQCKATLYVVNQCTSKSYEKESHQALKNEE